MIKCKNCNTEFNKKEIKQVKEHYCCPYCYDYLIPANLLKNNLLSFMRFKRW